MLFFPLPDAAVRQYIDSNTVFQEWLRVRAQAGKYSGGMYFKKQGDYEYLVKTNLRNRQQRIGPRSLETENIHATFHAAKDQVQTRLDAISQELKTCERLNKAVQVGRVPNTVVDILQKLQALGLHEHFVVVGTHALYAYEAAASVRMVASALATQDIDLLWDARKRVRFVADMDQLGLSMLDILQQVDKSFERKEGQNETAINAQGFEVDFLRRQAMDGDPHPFRLSADEGDLWPVQALRAHVLTSAPVFEQMVVASTGRMALMRTVAPVDFVAFKKWLALQTQRDAGKRRRDATQAEMVQGLLDEGLLLG